MDGSSDKLAHSLKSKHPKTFFFLTEKISNCIMEIFVNEYNMTIVVVESSWVVSTKK